jgi:superfamily I DNA/RNA helicase
VTHVSYRQAAQNLRDNAGQWSAYESQGNCVILAGPGSGKTKTITLKIARLLSEEVVLPRRVACITFSNACVIEIRNRVKQLGIGTEAGLKLATVHSFFLTEIVMPFAPLCGMDLPQPLKVAPPTTYRDSLRMAAEQACAGRVPHGFTMACERLRRTVVDQTGAEWRDQDQRQTAAIELHQANLSRLGFIDFDGIVLAALRLVQEFAWVRKALEAKFPILVIDEYQDLGLPLHRMISKLLSETHIRIIAVGDPDQSIYGFTGARPELLRELARSPNVTPIKLAMNYRSGSSIIRASSALLGTREISAVQGRHPGHVEARATGGNISTQVEVALSNIVPALLLQHPSWRLGDIAVLYMSFHEGNAVAAAADRQQMPYFRQDNGFPIKRTPMVNWVCDAAKWCSGGWREGTILLADLINAWRSLRPGLIAARKAADAERELTGTLLLFRSESEQLSTWLPRFKDKVLSPMFENEAALADDQELFESIVAATRPGHPLHGYTVSMFGHGGRDRERINFMTLYACKGLEFEATIIVGADAGKIPNQYCSTDEEINEAARLLYVGLTRAKEYVYVLYSSRPSPFIELFT